jgi:hypothetical protein
MGRIGVKANRPMPIAIARAVSPARATALGEGEHVGVVRIGSDWRTTSPSVDEVGYCEK